MRLHEEADEKKEHCDTSSIECSPILNFTSVPEFSVPLPVIAAHPNIALTEELDGKFEQSSCEPVENENASSSLTKYRDSVRNHASTEAECVSVRERGM